MVKPIDIKTLPVDKPFLLLDGLSKDFLIAQDKNLKYMHICPRCGMPVSHNNRVVYVAILNQVTCVNCADKFVANTRWFDEEEKTEKGNYNSMVQKLKDSKLWTE